MKKLIVFLTLIFFSSCIKKIQPNVLGNVYSSELPSQESWKSTVTFTDSGVVKAILYADNIKTPEGSSDRILNGNVKIDLFDEFGIHATIITSETGKANEDTYDIEVEGNVVVTSDSGVVIRTEKLKWNHLLAKIVSESNVHISTKTEIIRGIGLESDQYLRAYKIFQVSGTTLK